MQKTFLALLLICFLAGCGPIVLLPQTVPAPLPASPMPILVTNMPATVSATILPIITPTPSPFPTPSQTPTSSPSPTPEPPRLELSILGCDTGLDLLHEMGEVTNAYVRLSNTGQSTASNVCTVLSGNDEARPHPDKMGCVLSLPAGYQVTFKLTIDTELGNDTRLQVDVTSAEKVSASLLGGSCKAIGKPAQEAGPFGVVEPIQ